MTLNPEFQRNLWLQLSRRRLLAAPMIIGALYVLALMAVLNSGPIARDDIASATRWAFLLIVFVWGTRRAAEAVTEEVNGGTWDAQRMSAVGAWLMVEGKLFGATSFVWYCGLICLAAHASMWTRLEVSNRPSYLLSLVGAGLLAQIVALGSSLLLRRKASERRTLHVTFSQLLGIVAGVAALAVWSRSALPDSFELPIPDVSWTLWYGLDIPLELFDLASLAAFILWGLLGLYRLMRAELQYRTRPWAWLAFLLFAMLYALGFFYEWFVTGGAPGWAWLAVPSTVLVPMLYAVLFLEPKTLVGYRRFVAAASTGAWGRMLDLMPLWLPAFLILLGLGVTVALLLESAEIRSLPLIWRVARPDAAFVVAGLMFVARDIAFVLLLNFGERHRRADLTALVCLLLAYGPFAGVAFETGSDWLLAAFCPLPYGSPLVVLAPVAVELAVLLVLLRRRWSAGQIGASRAVPVAVAGTRASTA